MTRQNISTGTYANDGTGDTLRQAGQKINENFIELYTKLGGDSNVLSGEISVTSSGISFEGETNDEFETFLKSRDATQDNNIFLPNVSGNVVIDSASQTLLNKTLTSPIISGPQINDTSGDHRYIITPSELTASRNVTLPLLAQNDEIIFKTHAATLTNKTLTAPTISTPKITGSINDVNGAELIRLSSTASAVNEISIVNAAASNSPSINVAGTDTNINLTLGAKGTGSVSISKAAYVSAEITASGAASETASYIICNSGTPIAVTLADGSISGEYKVITNKGAGVATVTPNAFGPGTSIALDDNEGCTLIWDGDDWQLIGNYGGTVS
jgi:hypothetical protein